MPEDLQDTSKPIIQAAEAIGHVRKYVGRGMSDSFNCSCGWSSLWYWDGIELAYYEWLEHAKEVTKSQ